ncbi:MAG: hypothetical protein LBQ01_08600, partial [Prevotellaceae bacterium]|nr:hypothetical protein [Prevotellaceae bacterium]
MTDSLAFRFVPNNIPVYVPCGSKAAYQAAYPWSSFPNITVIPLSTAADITVKDTTVCYGTAATVTPEASGLANPVFQWYSTQTEATPFHTGDSYTTTNLKADTAFYLSVSGNGYCENIEGDRKEIRVTVSLTQSYPDIRVRVCPDAGDISLAKYIDTLDMITDIKWAGIAVTPEGTVSTGNLTFSRVHTLTYTVTSRCVNEQKRKVYLEVLRNGRMRPLKDTVEICHL